MFKGVPVFTTWETTRRLEKKKIKNHFTLKVSIDAWN